MNTQTSESWAVVRPQNKDEFYQKWQGHYWANLVAINRVGDDWWYSDGSQRLVDTWNMDEWWHMMGMVRCFHVRPSTDPQENEYLVIAEMPFPHEHLVLAHNFPSQDGAIQFLVDMYNATTCVWGAEVYVGGSTLMEYRMERGLI